MVRQKGFEAGDLLRTETTEASQEAQAIAEIKKVQAEMLRGLDPSIRGKVTMLPSVTIENIGDSNERKKRLTQLLKERGGPVSLTSEAEVMLKRLAFLKNPPQSERLVSISLAALGFTQQTTYGAILARASQLGLTPVEPEVGAWLRLAYLDQPEGEILALAMIPVAGVVAGAGQVSLFSLTSPSGRPTLDLISMFQNALWSPMSHFVFRADPTKAV